jgi:TonB family protein
MRRIFALFIFIVVAVTVSAQAPELHYPKHIEMPMYPAIARTAHVQGKITLLVSVDPSGKVLDAQVDPATSDVPLLSRSSIANVRTWTFVPSPAPFSVRIMYDYKLSESLPCDSGITKVTMDLPDVVTLDAAMHCVQWDSSKQH